MSVIGQTLPHDSARLHVTGAAQYIDDLPMPANSLHLVFGISTVAHGKIIDMNLDAVRQADGVVAVLTAADFPHVDVSPIAHDEPLLSNGDILFHGMPIFIVAAESHHKARKAAKLAAVEYQTLEPILTIDQAIAADSHLEMPRKFLKGEPDAVLVESKHRLKGQIDIGGQDHFYLEGQAALSTPQENSGMIVQCSTQHPTEIQHKVAHALGVGMHAVSVQVRRMGGGFGGKESQGNALAVATALVAARLGVACKMRYDRDDDMIITGKRHDARICYHVGFDDQGRIQALDVQQFIRCGWSQDLSLPVADRAMFHADNAYHLPNAQITSHRLRTHTVSNTAFRGFGGPQGMVGMERIVNHIAHHLDIDPLIIRQRNFYAPMENKAGQTTPYHMVVDDCVVGDLVDELVQTSDYHARRQAIAAWNDSQSILKKGIALTPVKFGISFTLTAYNQAGAVVHIYQDGSVYLNHGGTEMGQGLFIKTQQIAAEVLGISTARIQISATNTTLVPNTSATAASSGADLNGMAVKQAAEEIKTRLSIFLADKFETEASQILFLNDKVICKNKEFDFSDVIAMAYQARLSLSAKGFYSTPKISWDRALGRGRPFYYFTYGAAVSEVVIDTLTGEYRTLRADLLLDAGKSLNPAIDIGQLEGGYVQGAGWLTTEELVWNDQGQLKTHAPSTYKIPACSCRPDTFNAQLWSRGRNNEATIYRSKAVGEPPFMLGISVLMALSNALNYKASEYISLDAPATPERILQAWQRRCSQ